MDHLFAQRPRFNADISEWNTASVTTMAYMFSNMLYDSYTSVDMSGHSEYTSQDTKGRFNGDISRWNTAAVVDMAYMFAGASSFNGNISQWDTSSVCSNLYPDIKRDANSPWTTGYQDWGRYYGNLDYRVYNPASPSTEHYGTDDPHSFFDAPSILVHDNYNKMPDNYKFYEPRDMSLTFATIRDRHSFREFASWWDGFEQYENHQAGRCMDGMFLAAKAFNGNLSQWNTASVLTMHSMFKFATAFNGDISLWNTAGVVRMTEMFRSATAFDGDISRWNTGAVLLMEGMFRSTKSFTGDISQWNTEKVRSMETMFAYANFGGNLSQWNTARVLSMDSMFSFDDSSGVYLDPTYCADENNKYDDYSNPIRPSGFSGDISQWNTAAVVSMNGMFKDSCFKGDISQWNTANVVTMTHMFARTTMFASDLSGWNTGQVRDMSFMFHESLDFDSDISLWNTGSVIRMDSMFQMSHYQYEHVMYSLTYGFGTRSQRGMRFIPDDVTPIPTYNVNISKWNTMAVDSMKSMFKQNRLFNGDITAWFVDVKCKTDSMFDNTHAFNQDISIWPQNRRNALRHTLREWLQQWDEANKNSIFSADTVEYILKVFFHKEEDIERGGYRYREFHEAASRSQPEWYHFLSSKGFSVSQIAFLNQQFRDEHTSDRCISGNSKPQNWEKAGRRDIHSRLQSATCRDLFQYFEYTALPRLVAPGMFMYAHAWYDMFKSDTQTMLSGNGAAQLWIPRKYYADRTALRVALDECYSHQNNRRRSYVWGPQYINEHNEINLRRNVCETTICPAGQGHERPKYNFSPLEIAGSSNCMEIGRWDVSAVTDMSYLFDSVPTDGGYYPNISLWNTARVTDMTSMFRNTRVFNGNISQWNVEAVTNMDYMFENAEAFDGDLSKWNTLALTNKQDMFLHATAWNDAYTNVGTGTDGPPNMWETKAI